MSVSNALNRMRESAYGSKPDMTSPEKGSESGVRMFKLSDEEMGSMGKDMKPGQEITLQVSGRLEEDGHFHVMSVSGPSGSPEGMDGMKEEMASRMGMPNMS